MPTTTNYALRYPASTDPADVPTDMQHLAADVDAALGGKTTVSAISGGPPGSPGNNDIWIATAVDANGTRWAFQYDAAWVTDSFKWKFIGGPPVVVNTSIGAVVPDSAAHALTPSFTCVRAGVYALTGGYWGQCGGGAAGLFEHLFFLGGVGIAGAAIASVFNVTASQNFTLYSSPFLVNASAGQAVQSVYLATAAGNISFGNYSVTPTRIS